MFNRGDLDRLIASDAYPAVTLLLPTHIAGRDVRQDPIRLRNLVDGAAKQLVESGLRGPDAERLLEPARRLIADENFWRAQGRGLAVFLAPGIAEVFRLPFEVPEELVVGRHFHVKHLLPALAGDGGFVLLTISARRTRLFEAGRHRLEERHDPDLAAGISEIVEATNYESTRQTSPVARPHAGAPGGSKATHTFEDPEDLRKAQLIEHLRRVADAVDRHAGDRSRPIVLAAHPEIQGHFRAIARLPHLARDGIAENPDALEEGELHRRAYAIVAPLFAAAEKQARDRLAMHLGNDSGRATVKLEEAVKAAIDGRVDTLFLATDEHLWGQVDRQSDTVASHDRQGAGDDDLLDYAAIETLRKGGQVTAVPQGQMPCGGVIAATFRY